MIESAIMSVISQGHSNLEVIVIDDCSTDNTPSIVLKLQKENSRIKYERQLENSGVSAARNRGLELATGDYIGFLDSDDTYTENFISDLLHANNEFHRSFDILTGYKTYYTEHSSEPKGSTELDLSKLAIAQLAPSYFELKGNLLDISFNTKVVTLGAALFSRTCIESTRFDTTLYQNEDSLFIRDLLARIPSVLYCQKSLLNYMIHDENHSLAGNFEFDDKYKRMIAGQIQYFEVALKRYELKHSTISMLKSKLSRLYFWMLGFNYYRRHNKLLDYIRCYNTSFRYSPDLRLFLSFIKGLFFKPGEKSTHEYF